MLRLKAPTFGGYHVQMNIEIQGRTKTLYQGDDAGPGPAFTGETCTVDEISFDGTGNNPERTR